MHPRIRYVLVAALLLSACTTATQPASAPTPAQPAALAATALPVVGAIPVATVSSVDLSPVPTPALGVAAPTTIPVAISTTAATAVATPAPLSVSATAVPTAIPDPTRVSSIQSAFNLIMDKYYRPETSNSLLNAAWLGVSDRAKTARSSADLSAPRLTGNRTQDWTAFQDRYTQLVKSDSSLDPVQLSFAAVQSMAGSLEDDHTAFLSPQINAQFQQESAGGTRTVGIGVTLDASRAPFVIQEVIPGAPADKAGVKPGDSVVSVDGHDVSRSTLSQLSSMLRGEAGTPVAIELKRPSGGQVAVTITRAAYVTPVLQSRILPNGVGVLKLRQFPETYITFSDGKTFEQELDGDLQVFEQSGVKFWVIDLRDNPGGSVSSLAEFVGRFVPTGLVVVSVGRAQDRQETPVDGHLFGAQRPIAVLINRGSASSSELFAAAIHDNGRGVIVGEPSAGAVNASEEFPLSDGAAIQVTVAQALSGKGEKPLDGQGVKPDVSVASVVLSPDDLAKGRDPQLDQAVASLQGPKYRVAPAPTPMPHPALPPDQIRATLGPLGATESMIPAGPDQHLAGSQIIDTVDEFISGAESIESLRSKVLQRGWLGTLQQFFGSHDPPTYSVEMDLYGDAKGATTSITTNDYPKQFQSVPPPIKLGDDTVAYKGMNSSLGGIFVAWRHGRVILSVSYFGPPGTESFDPLVTIATALDTKYQAHPIS